MMKRLVNSVWELFTLVVDRLTLSFGDIAGFIVLYMVFAVTVDVILRYVFNSPTVWVVETSTYLLVVMTSLGLAYTLREKGHVRVDIVVNRFPKKFRNWMMVISSICFFILTVFLFRMTLDGFLETLDYGTTSRTGLDIILAPFQAVMPVGLLVTCFLLMCNIYNETKVALRKSKELCNEGK